MRALPSSSTLFLACAHTCCQFKVYALADTCLICLTLPFLLHFQFQVPDPTNEKSSNAVQLWFVLVDPATRRKSPPFVERTPAFRQLCWLRDLGGHWSVAHLNLDLGGHWLVTHLTLDLGRHWLVTHLNLDLGGHWLVTHLS